MNEDKDLEQPEKKKIEIRDFAEEQKPEESIDLTSVEHTLDDETIDEAIAEEQREESGNESDSETSEDSKEETETDDAEESQSEDTENDVESKEVKSQNGVETGTNDEEIVESLDDKELNDAVDDIVREESDDVLVLDDAIKEPEVPEAKGFKKFTQKLKNGISWWWNHTLIRNLSLVFIFVAVMAAALVPVSRYAVLNAFGVRVESSMKVVDNETSLPLENIRVTLQNQEMKTDANGEVRFTDLKLGNSTLQISRRGYAESRENIVLGWGSNPLGDKRITATGVQYSFELRDWISDAPLTDAAAVSGEYTARADENGVITLTLSEDAEEDAEITLRAAGYRDETYIASDLSVDENNKVFMVNDRKHLFVSNRDSKYDVYSIDLDGKNEKVILNATGKERDIPQLYPHPMQQKWALIGSHEGETNADNYVLDGLYIIDPQQDTSDIKRIARSERIAIVGWSGDYLVFWQVVEGTSQGNPERSKLYSYNFITGERIELAAANYFNDVELVSDEVYYAVSGFAVPQSYARLFKVKANGEQKVQVLNKQVYSIFRTDIEQLLYSAANQEWYEQTLPQEPEKAERRTSVPNNYMYVFSPSSESVSWVRVRDGQGVLQYKHLTDESGGIEQEAAVDAGIREALYWLGDKAIVYRVVKSGETADYLVSLEERPDNSEKISKITNITIQTFNGY